MWILLILGSSHYSERLPLATFEACAIAAETLIEDTPKHVKLYCINSELGDTYQIKRKGEDE